MTLVRSCADWLGAGPRDYLRAMRAFAGDLGRAPRSFGTSMMWWGAAGWGIVGGAPIPAQVLFVLGALASCVFVTSAARRHGHLERGAWTPTGEAAHGIERAVDRWPRGVPLLAAVVGVALLVIGVFAVAVTIAGGT